MSRCVWGRATWWHRPPAFTYGAHASTYAAFPISPDFKGFRLVSLKGRSYA